jgi:hypothetical protein
MDSSTLDTKNLEVSDHRHHPSRQYQHHQQRKKRKEKKRKERKKERKKEKKERKKEKKFIVEGTLVAHVCNSSY